MGRKLARKPTVSDAMIVIAATAPALAVMRHELAWPDFSLPARPAGPLYCYYLNEVRWTSYWASYLFAAWSIALLVVRLRRPRPALRRLTSEPGMVVGAVAAIVLGIRLINILSVACVMVVDDAAATAWAYLRDVAMGEAMPDVPSEIGCAVVAAWTIQALGGRWRPEPSWIDRAGRLLGLFWIATIPASWFHSVPGI